MLAAFFAAFLAGAFFAADFLAADFLAGLSSDFFSDLLSDFSAAGSEGDSPRELLAASTERCSAARRSTTSPVDFFGCYGA